MEYRAALLASHGFASLALDYLTPKITLETGKMVGNQYFEVKPTSIKRLDCFMKNLIFVHSDFLKITALIYKHLIMSTAQKSKELFIIVTGGM